MFARIHLYPDKFRMRRSTNEDKWRARVLAAIVETGCYIGIVEKGKNRAITGGRAR